MTRRQTVITGACLCGAVRFEASGPPRRVTHCHCSMCRRATGAIAGTFVVFESRLVTWFGVAVQRYASSAVAWRGFCATCGSSVCFGFKPRPERAYIALGIFDDPGAYPAGFHDYPEEKLHWLCLDEHLPSVAQAKQARVEQ